MKILEEIIDLAVDNSGPLSVLLRKRLLLAHTLKNQRLQTWAEEELVGARTWVTGLA
ncbi:MAG: AbiTii domain-containing protein [Beijerinckiaceae bacterium]